MQGRGLCGGAMDGRIRFTRSISIISLPDIDGFVPGEELRRAFTKAVTSAAVNWRTADPSLPSLFSWPRSDEGPARAAGSSRAATTTKTKNNLRMGRRHMSLTVYVCICEWIV